MSLMSSKKAVIGGSGRRGVGPLAVVDSVFQSGATATITIPAHKRNDLIIIAAHYNSASPPAPPSGWTVIKQFGGFSGSGDRGMTIAYRFADNDLTVSGSWTVTGLIALSVIVIRGVKAVGNSESLSGNQSGTTKTLPAVTISGADSYVLGVAITLAAFASSGLPSGMERVVPSSGATSTFALTTGAVSSFASRTYTSSVSDARNRTASVELLN